MKAARVWFTSDLHLGHPLVSKLRGFGTVEAHDEAVLAGWRRLVRDNDVVYLLGDLTLQNPARHTGTVLALPGRKRLILGNHDRGHPLNRPSPAQLDVYRPAFELVATSAVVRLAGHDVLLSHFPYTADHTEQARYAQWRLPDCGEWLLHGHTHSRGWRTGGRQIHVGLDAWDLRPVGADEVAAKLTAIDRLLDWIPFGRSSLGGGSGEDPVGDRV